MITCSYIRDRLKILIKTGNQTETNDNVSLSLLSSTIRYLRLPEEILNRRNLEILRSHSDLKHSNVQLPGSEIRMGPGSKSMNMPGFCIQKEKPRRWPRSRGTQPVDDRDNGQQKEDNEPIEVYL